jgi:hypothetical protein
MMLFQSLSFSQAFSSHASASASDLMGSSSLERTREALDLF